MKCPRLFYCLIALSALILSALCTDIAGACEGRLVDDQALLHAPVCLPETPKRIVVLDSTYNLGMALDLNLTVVGAPLTGLQDAALLARAEEMKIDNIGHASEPSVERVISLSPDLILADAVTHGQVYDLASRVAPTVMVDAQNWKTYFRAIASATGTSERAGNLLERYEARVLEIRNRAPDLTVSVVRVAPHGLQIYLDGPEAYAPYAVLRDAGIKRTDYETTGGDEFLKRPDWESLAALDGDILLYVIGSP